jgi:hypothetical protein
MAQTREPAAQGRPSRRVGPPLARQDMSGQIVSASARKTTTAGEERGPSAHGRRAVVAHTCVAVRRHHVWSGRSPGDHRRRGWRENGRSSC